MSDSALRELGETLLRRVDEITDLIVDRLMVLPGYRDRARVDQWPDTRGTVEEILRAAFVEPAHAQTTALRLSRELVRARASSGIPASSVTTALDWGHREMLTMMAGAAQGLGLDADTTVSAAIALHDVIGVLISTARRGYDDLLAEDERHGAARRALALRTLVSAASTSTQRDQAAAVEGLSPTTEYHVVRGRARTDSGLVALEKSLEHAAREHPGLVTTIDGDPAGVIVSPPLLHGDDAVLAVGRRGSMSTLADQFALVTRVLDGAFARRASGVVSVDNMGFELWVTVHDDIGEFARERYLAPLASLGRVGDDIAETLRAYLACSMSEGETARALHLHRNSVRYRLTRYADLTGFDVRDPEVVAGVWWALASTPMTYVK